MLGDLPSHLPHDTLARICTYVPLLVNTMNQEIRELQDEMNIHDMDAICQQ